MTKSKSSSFVVTTSKLVGLSVILTSAFATNYLLAAWSNPTSNPTGGNVDAPINTSGTAQVKTGALSFGSFSAYGDSMVQETSPQIEFSDTDHDDWWIHVNSGHMYFLLDENDDGSWAGESPWPLVLANSGYAQFENKVYASEYCDRSGGNCFDPASAGGDHSVSSCEWVSTGKHAGIDYQWHRAECSSDKPVMSGWQCFATEYLDGSCQVKCCSLN